MCGVVCKEWCRADRVSVCALCVCVLCACRLNVCAKEGEGQVMLAVHAPLNTALQVHTQHKRHTDLIHRPFRELLLFHLSSHPPAFPDSLPLTLSLVALSPGASPG